MIDHYNAFISYRHAPLDSAIAEHVQHSLERFTIPDKIKKKTGMKRIQRVFRDKEELPITSNLSETISAALEDADFLIVICSNSTKESQWVRREIQYFLQHHSRDHVLTVLAEGDPYEVIPEELLSEERKYLDMNGVEHTVRVPLEPLSCDYRLPRRQADKEELPRLAAPIIGCSYDELMDRRRAYRIRRMLLAFTLIFAIMLAFGAYMFRSSMKIRENYQQAMRNQSLYLAHESQTLMKSKHRTEAMLVAMAALPGENSDRPVTAEAVRALTDATLAYTAKDGYTINPIFTYSMPGEVEKFVVSKEGLYLAAYDKIGNLYVWDAENHTKLYEVEHKNSQIHDIAFYEDEVLLIQYSSNIDALKPKTGKVLWSYSSPNLGSFNALSGLITFDSCIYVLDYLSNIIQKIDIETGEQVSEVKIHFSSSQDNAHLFIDKFALSPDGKTMAFLGTDNTKDTCYGYIDLESSKTWINSIETSSLTNIAWYDEKHFLVSSVSNGQSMINGTPLGMTILNSLDMEILCLDITDVKTETIPVLWTSGFTSKGTYTNSAFIPLQVNNEIAFYRGNTCAIYDIKTGEMKHLYDAESSLVDCSDNDNNGELLFITSDGKLGTPLTNLSKDTISVMPVFSNSICYARISNGIYSKDLYSTDIIYYNLGVYDDEFTPLPSDQNFGTSERSMMTEDTLAMITIDNNGKRNLNIVDMKSNKLIATHILNDETEASNTTYFFNIISISNGIIYISASNSSTGTSIMTYDAKDGDLLETVKLTDEYISTNWKNRAVEGKYSFLIKEGKEYQLGIYDLEKTKTKTYSLEEIDSKVLWNISALQYIPERELVIITASEQDYYLDLESEELLDLEFPETWEFASSASCSADYLAVTDGSSILVFGKGDDPIEISCGGKNCVATHLTHVKKQEILFAVFEDGTLYRYDPRNGDLLGVTNISISESISNNKSYLFSDDGSELYLTVSSTLSIIDTDSWYEIAAIPNCLGYYPSKDRFYAVSYENRSNSVIGYFPHYSVADLVEKASELCGEAQLSEAQKSAYGL